MSVVGTVRSFVTGTYTVTRQAASTLSGGWAVAGSTSTLNIDAGIWPLTGRELENLPEGQHGSEVRQLFTETELYTRAPGQEPDVIAYDGEDWTVIEVQKWSSYYKALIARTEIP